MIIDDQRAAKSCLRNITSTNFRNASCYESYNQVNSYNISAAPFLIYPQKSQKYDKVTQTFQAHIKAYIYDYMQ